MCVYVHVSSHLQVADEWFEIHEHADDGSHVAGVAYVGEPALMPKMLRD